MESGKLVQVFHGAVEELEVRKLSGFLWVLLVCVLPGCSRQQAASPRLTEKQKEMVSVAREAVGQYETWADHAEYAIERRRGEWWVSAWRVVHPEATGKQRFVPWGVRTVIIDDTGRVLDYRNNPREVVMPRG